MTLRFTPDASGLLVTTSKGLQLVDLATLTSTPCDPPAHDDAYMPGVDLALRLSATRMVLCAQHMVQLRDTTTLRWSVSPVPDGYVREGAVISEGRAIALYIAQRHDRGTVVVLDTAKGLLQHRIAVKGATLVRFAAKRGLAVVVVGQCRLVLIDLRFGRILADSTQERDIADVGIDDAGQQIVLRYDHELGEIVCLDTAELFAPRAVPESDIDVSVSVSVTDPDPPAPAPAPVLALTPAPVLACPALAPRVARAVPTPDELASLLAAQRGWIVAALALSITQAWDEGRAAPDRMPPQRHLLEAMAHGLRGLASDDVARALARADEASTAWAGAVARLTTGTSPLSVLAEDHGLDVLAQQILLVVAAPALWGELAQLYGMLVADRARPLCDELLLATVLAPVAPAHTIAAALDRDAPLVRAGLVRVGPGLQRPFLALTADPIVVRLLRGAPVRDELGATCSVRAATPTFEQLQIASGVKARIADELARADAPLRVVVRGRGGSGRHTLIGAIAGASAREVAAIDVAGLLRGAGNAEELVVALQRAELVGLVPCLDQLERTELQPLRDAIRDVIRRFPGPVFVRLRADASPPIDPGYVTIDLPAQTLGERAQTWASALERERIAVADPSELAARFAIGPAIIERVAARVGRDPGERPLERIDAAIRQHLDSELGEVATRVERLATWSQVILPPDIHDSVTELIGRIRQRRRVFDTWGFDRVMASSRGVTALFQGAPGTGKTLVASAIANELGLELYRVDVSRIMSKWIGETEQKLAKLFDAAEDANAIILFDEADSLFGKRTEVKSSIDRYANVEVNYLLQRLDTFEGIAILTSNLGSSIDSAFKRRLSFRLTFPFPDEEQREQLWRAHLPHQLPTRGELELARLAQRYRLSGGYIRNCALRAAFLAAEQGCSLTVDHLERAVKAEFREIGKLADTGALE
jgi:hypothetical protein